jgi:hypothetical protein
VAIYAFFREKRMPLKWHRDLWLSRAESEVVISRIGWTPPSATNLVRSAPENLSFGSKTELRGVPLAASRTLRTVPFVRINVIS